jgi:hypothetical protein
LTNAGTQARAARWLLIFDNVEKASIIEPFWPTGSHGCIIITTRNPSVARHLGQDTIAVPLFTAAESSRLLFAVNTGSDELEIAEKDAVKLICTRLGNLPLVLHRIAVYADSIHTSYQSFIRHYPDFDKHLLFENHDDDAVSSYQASISTTWTMALPSMELDARSLMETVVLFDPDSIPLELFEPCIMDDK